MKNLLNLPLHAARFPPVDSDAATIVDRARQMQPSVRRRCDARSIFMTSTERGSYNDRRSYRCDKIPMDPPVASAARAGLILETDDDKTPSVSIADRAILAGEMRKSSLLLGYPE